jgi:hypothetical protein
MGYGGFIEREKIAVVVFVAGALPKIHLPNSPPEFRMKKEGSNQNVGRASVPKEVYRWVFMRLVVLKKQGITSFLSAEPDVGCSQF